MSLADQIKILKQRGLVIDDEAEAERLLGLIGYFRLAEYWRPFEADKVRHIFKPDSHFRSAISLYEFDGELKMLIFSAIQRLEIAMRAKVIHHFSMKFGPFWFMDETKFRSQSRFESINESLRSEIARSYEDFMTDHFRKYDEPDMPPAWKTLEVATFGTLSKLYANFDDPEVKKAVSEDFDIPAYKFLRSWMKSLTVIRNACAHHARLWNQRFPLSPMMPRRVACPWIAQLPVVTNSLYPNLCVIAYWLNSVKPANTFSKDLKAILAKHPNVDPAAMGFTRNWREEPLWR